MNRVELSLRRVYFLEEGRYRKIALSVNYWGSSELREDFKQFILSNNLLPSLNVTFLDTMLNGGFIPIMEAEVANFFNVVTKSYKDRCRFMISKTGYIPVQLSYTQCVILDLSTMKFYTSMYQVESSSASIELSNDTEIKEYINGLIKIFSLYV